MSVLLRSYLKYARGESRLSPWMLLYPLQYVAKPLMKLRIGLYNRGIFSVTDPALPTISIGNNSLGGTNKTPMVDYMVRHLRDAGIKAGIVSRGYKAKDHPPLWIGQDRKSTDRDFAGDEPLMLAKRLPDTKVVVSRNRLEGVKLLAALGADLAVTDDTFQHKKMARDVDIVLIDSTCPFGNGNVIPAGLMREPMSAFGRADIIVLTKANHASAKQIDDIKKKLSPYISEDCIFTADLKLERWITINSDGNAEDTPKDFVPHGRYIALSAIGNPDGFYKFLADLGVEIADKRTFRDHHTLTAEDIAQLDELANARNADGFICTEKDLMNIPSGTVFRKKLYVPTITISMHEPLLFKKKILSKLKPYFLVTSNGHGEDAIGVVLAKKLKERFKSAQIDAFTLVGSGKAYTKNNIRVVSPPSEMPSGGVVKYNISDLVGDMRHGLRDTIIEQHDTMRSLRGRYRAPICVGDVYLLVSLLWCQGMRPLLIATAKSVHLNGHIYIEKWLMRKRAHLVWTRDEETAAELTKAQVPAVFYGNPIMDLLDEAAEPAFAWNGKGAKILLLPGSRPRAYEDINLILDAVTLLSRMTECCFVMVPAPTIDVGKMAESTHGWKMSDDGKKLICSSESHAEVFVCREPLAAAACGAEILIGLGGTANQLCAGLGIPVISIIERGKLRQKKLLREAEILVPPEAEKLAEAAFKVLSDSKLRKKMQEAGIRNLGRTGALDNAVEYCAKDMGWDARCRVYEKYEKYINEG